MMAPAKRSGRKDLMRVALPFPSRTANGIGAGSREGVRFSAHDFRAAAATVILMPRLGKLPVLRLNEFG